MNVRLIETPDLPSRERNIMCYDLDVYCWRALCFDVRPRMILELGTGEGLFLSTVMPCLPDSQAVTINAPVGKTTPGTNTTFRVPDSGKIGRLFRGKGYEGRIKQVFCLTRDMLSSLGDDRFDLVHIDASHDKEDVIADTLNSLKVLNPGGTIVWHDFHPGRSHPWIADVCAALECLYADGVVNTVFWFKRSWVCYSKFGEST